MAPYIQESSGADSVSQTALQSENAMLNHGQVRKPVADNFMYDFKYNHSLPTTSALGINIPTDCDAQREAEGILASLASATSAGDAQAFAALFLDYGETSHKLRLACSR
jgi:hypothetical protein